jgi:hypothetical protein
MRKVLITLVTVLLTVVFGFSFMVEAGDEISSNKSLTNKLKGDGSVGTAIKEKLDIDMVGNVEGQDRGGGFLTKAVSGGENLASKAAGGIGNAVGKLKQEGSPINAATLVASNPIAAGVTAGVGLLAMGAGAWQTARTKDKIDALKTYVNEYSENMNAEEKQKYTDMIAALEAEDKKDKEFADQMESLDKQWDQSRDRSRQTQHNIGKNLAGRSEAFHNKVKNDPIYDPKKEKLIPLADPSVNPVTQGVTIMKAPSLDDSYGGSSYGSGSYGSSYQPSSYNY